MSIDMPLKNEFPSEEADVEIIYDDNNFEEQGGNEADIKDASSEEDEETTSKAQDVEAETESESEPEDVESELEDDSEYQSYSASVKKRIKREIRLRKEVERNLRAIAAQRDQAVQYAYQSAGAFQQLQKMQQQYDSLQEQYYKLLDTSLGSAIEQKMGELQRAKEEGDTSAELKAQAELDELRFNKRQLSELAASFAQQKEKAASQNQYDGRLQFGGSALPQMGAQQPAIPQLAINWVNRNKWIREEKYAPQREYIKTLDMELLSLGYDPNTEKYYDELERRLVDAFPSVKKKLVPKNKGKSPVAPSTNSGGGTTKNVGSKRIVLTRTDIETMRKFGLDPTNKEHVLVFAKQRVGE